MALTTTGEEKENAGMLTHYAALPGIYDEMIDHTGAVRDVWQPIASWLSDTSDETQASTAQKIDRLVYEHFFDPQREQLGWHLDNVPLILNDTTWQMIEKAAIQRAVLYNHLLADLYGEQETLTNNLIPPSLLHSDQSFLRPLHGTDIVSPRLTFLALDFARDPQGNWRVIDVHTETPAGHGFALANRMVIAEVADGLFRKSRTARIGPFYQDLMDHLYQSAGADDPLIVVLAPGSEQSSYGGHAFMARYMNLRRVHGSDLRVVGNRIFLKTIDGLKKIDLIVRTIEGHRADPLELQPDAFDGPVGLVQASRKNPELLVNGLGTAVVENRGLSGYLYQLSRHFLNEDLVITDAPRLWIGDPSIKQEVLHDIDSYVFRYAQEGTGSPGDADPGRSTLTMNASERANFEAQIHFSGELLVAEKPIGFATAPAWTPQGLKPEHYALRVYLAAVGDSYKVMPGGLALSIDDGMSVSLSSSRAHSRDVWVAAEETRQPRISLKRLAKDNPIILRHAQPLQSSMADNLFWLGRYVERADGMLRVIRQALHNNADDLYNTSTSPHSVHVLRAALNPEDQTNSRALHSDASIHDEFWIALQNLCSDTYHSNGLPHTFERIRDIATHCRNQLSEESWRILSRLNMEPLSNQLTAGMPKTKARVDIPTDSSLDMIQAADELIIGLAAFNGMANENMTRSSGWIFLDLGRHIERTYQLAILLKTLFVSTSADDQESQKMIFALQAADSFMTFRSRYRFAPEAPHVLDLLVIDERNPRALAFQLAEILAQIERLPKSSTDAVRTPDQRLALDMLSKVRLSNVEELAKVEETGKRTALDALLMQLTQELPELSKFLSRQYFSLADELPRRL